MKVAKENQRQLERLLQSDGGKPDSEIFVSRTVNISWSEIYLKDGNDSSSFYNKLILFHNLNFNKHNEVKRWLLLKSLVRVKLCWKTSQASMGLKRLFRQRIFCVVSPTKW